MNRLQMHDFMVRVATPNDSEGGDDWSVARPLPARRGAVKKRNGCAKDPPQREQKRGKPHSMEEALHNTPTVLT